MLDNNYLWSPSDAWTDIGLQLLQLKPPASKFGEGSGEKVPWFKDPTKVELTADIAGAASGVLNGITSLYGQDVLNGKGWNMFNNIGHGLAAAASVIPGYGTLIAGGIKGGLAAANAINTFGAKKNDLVVQKNIDPRLLSSYGGFSKVQNAALDSSGLKTGLVGGRKIRKEAKQNLLLYDLWGNPLLAISDDSQARMDRANQMNTWQANNLAITNAGLNYNRLPVAKNGGALKEKAQKILSSSEKKSIPYEEWVKTVPEKFLNGGQMNVIPEGALHARLHHMEEGSPELKGLITQKGIPVVSEEGGKILQQAEIEQNEIVFNLEVTKKLEELYKKYYAEKSSEKDEIAIEAGKLLATEIIDNTNDRTGLMTTIS